MRYFFNYFVSFIIIVGFIGCTEKFDPNWQLEQNAKQSQTHPFAGFWKFRENCEDEFGLAIGPMGEGKYYIAFCGPGGCGKTDHPESTIINDPAFKVIDENTMDVMTKEGFKRIKRCNGRKKA